jgi:hypothetical protein
MHMFVVLLCSVVIENIQLDGFNYTSVCICPGYNVLVTLCKRIHPACEFRAI